MTQRIYLAGPDVFLRDAGAIGEAKRDLCRAFGFEGLFPLDNGADPADATAIFRANAALMRRAEIGLFNLTPFRGPSADAGTVFELGYMHALGKPVHGYSAAPGTYRPRVESPDGGAHDRDGFLIEDFGRADNLMITEAIAGAGGHFIARAEVGLAAMAAFRDCLAALAEGRAPAI